MPRFTIAPAAAGDIESILAWTHEHFGERARLRYEALVIRALLDVAEKPDLPGSFARPEIADAVRSYHLFYSRRHVKREAGRVAHPRHFILYRTAHDGTIEVIRVLHDSMDIVRHVPKKHERG